MTDARDRGEDGSGAGRAGGNGADAGALFDVSGKTALVTGGSRGIGLMIARGLVQAGAHVIVSSRKAADVQAAAAELAEIGECHAIPADISTQEGAQELAAAVRQRFPALHILVNNAGATWGAPLEQFPAGGWQKVLATNVEGVFHLTVALLEPLRAAASAEDPARVINIGSINGLAAPAVENYSYSASKAAVHMLTRHLAKRLADQHITVNAIAPGPFQSKMMAFALEDPEARAAIEAGVPLRRIGRPDDVAGLTIFLSSRAGAYMTGTVIPLDGGVTGCN
ncbi:MAG TPA: SDR family oxidoreductase [Solirubrobacteraceae bacterium]|nr:SDR family oxidoreductase [Solirubrobacteraceae bacterium]